MTTKLSIRQISVLTGLDRDTVTRRLQGLHREPGAKNARLLRSARGASGRPRPGLKAPEGTLEQIKARNETLSARLKEVDLAKKTKGLPPDQFCFGLIDTFIKFVAGRFGDLRLRGAVNREWIAECERHWGELYRQFCRDFELTLPAASQTQQDS
jgi:hypothetical protein